MRTSTVVAALANGPASRDGTTRQLLCRHTAIRHLTLAGDPYALPISQIHEIIRYTPSCTIASNDPWVQGVINLRGVIVRVYNIAARLGLEPDVGEHSKIVIVESETHTAGLIVDAVDEVRTITSDQLEQASCADRTLFDSIAKMDDGRLVVLLNQPASSATSPSPHKARRHPISGETTAAPRRRRRPATPQLTLTQGAPRTRAVGISLRSPAGTPAPNAQVVYFRTASVV